MNRDFPSIEGTLEERGYRTMDYPESLKKTVSQLMQNFEAFCNQTLEHKQHMLYHNSAGYENRDRTANPELVDHKESFYIKPDYTLPGFFLPSKADEAFVASCEQLFGEIAPLVDSSTQLLSEAGKVDLSRYFDTSALTIRAIHYYPDSSAEIAHSHVDRGGQTYHLYETTGGLEVYWHGKWNEVLFGKDKMVYFPCLQAQYASRCQLKGLCHRVVSNSDSRRHGRYSLVLFVDYNKLPYKYSMAKSGPIEKTFQPGQNYDMPFSTLQNYFEEKKQLFRKGVSALILNSKDQFLLVNLESFETHFFAVPGGGLEPGETLEEAAYREVKEELGIGEESLELLGMSNEPVRFVFKTKKLERDGSTYDGSERYFFAFRFTGKESEIKPQKGEVRTHTWVPFGDLGNHLLFDDQLEETVAKIAELLPFIHEDKKP